MRRTLLSESEKFSLTLVEPDEAGTYPIHFESTCLNCQAVVATTSYGCELEDDPDAEQRVERDGAANYLVAHLHQCARAAGQEV